MKAELRELDVNGDLLDGFVPDDLINFSFEVTATIGPEGDKGANHFMVTVCDEKNEGILMDENNASRRKGRGIISISSFDVNVIRSRIEEIVDASAGESWIEIVNSLRCHLRWEYDGYENASGQ